jgi:hypothetical protein
MDIYFNIHVDHISSSWTIRRCTCKRNIEATSHNNCCHGKEVSLPITYSECVPVALVLQHELRIHYYFVCGLVWLYHIFPHYFIQIRIFEKKKLFERKLCVLILSTNFV